MGIYLDNSSTSFPKADGLGQVIAEHIDKGAYNSSRGGYKMGLEVSKKILDTRFLLADFFHAPNPKNVIFSSGVTASLNTVIKGMLQEGDSVILSKYEHNAVMRPLNQFNVKTYQVENPTELEETIHTLQKNKTPAKLVILNHASNVTGDIFDIEHAKKICKKHNLFLVVDCAQTAGFTDINAEGIDALCFTGHKGLLGMQGVGGMIISDRLAQQLPPLIVGGTGSKSDKFEHPDILPDKYEAGTLNILGIISLLHSVNYINKIGVSSIGKIETDLATTFENEIKNNFDQKEIRVIANQPISQRAPIVSLDMVGGDNAEIAYRLDKEYGIMTRTGMHCAPLAHKNMNTFPQGTIRFSFGHKNTQEEVDITINALKKITGDTHT